MRNGLKTINIGFLVYIQKEWMGGVNYFKNLFNSIKELNKVSSDYKLIPYIKKPNDENIEKLFSENCHYIEYIPYKDIRYYFQKIMKKITSKEFNEEKYIKYKISPKLHLTSHNNAEFLKHKKAISWIPDFQHLHLPEMFDEEELNIRNELFQNQIKKAKLVILSSNDALSDFKKFAPKDIKKARILHFVSMINPEIYQKTDKIKEEIIKKYNLPEKYFYIPNQFWKHKNHKVVFEAMAKLKKEGININLVCTGFKNDYRNSQYFGELKNLIKENNLENNIKILGLIDEIEVYCLMRNCISIINPSFFEGWSTTVEEAKSLGKNIILSDINVHKEQNPPEGTFFNPNNSEELKEILKEKWQNKKSEPDYELEKRAKEKLHGRIVEFANEYKKIVLELIR